MPALTTTHVITQKRDGRAFDEVSDAVDEGRCTFFGILDRCSKSLTFARVYSERAKVEDVG
jgi:hypothetical protein